MNSPLDTRIDPPPAYPRDALIECCLYDWSDISPVIFGSLFQAVMNDIERRSLGAHFTSEKNIKRVVSPLFLDSLHSKLALIKYDDQNSIEKFRKENEQTIF